MSDAANEPLNNENPDTNTEPPTDDATLLDRINAAESSVAQLREQNAAVITAYRDAIRSSNPTLPAELIDGDSVDAINESVTRAAQVRDRILEANAQHAQGNGHDTGKVPAGGGSISPIPADATPRQLIKLGLDKYRQQS